MRRFFLVMAALFGAVLSVNAQNGSTGSMFTHIGEPESVARLTEPVDTLNGSRVWATADYLVWFTRPQDVPILVGTVPDSAVQNFQSGSTLPEGTPVTSLFPGYRKIRSSAQNGVRGRVGGNLTDLFGVDAGGFVLQNVSEGGNFNSPGSPPLFRSYTRALDGSTQYLYVALPGEYAGRVSVLAETQTWGVDGNARFNWFRVFSDRTDLLAGFRYLNVKENLEIENVAVFPSGNVLGILDTFRTRNNLYVGQVGFHSQWSSGRFAVDLVNKFGMGAVNQRVEIRGANGGSGLAIEPTGLYTQAGLTGDFERNRFVATNEFGLSLGFKVTQRVNVNVGYNVLWVSSVVRAASAIDQVINDSGIRYLSNPPADPNNRRPTFNFDRASSDLWIQGLTLGVCVGF